MNGNGILVCPAGGALKEVYRTSYQVGDTVTVSCYNGQTRTYTVMGIVRDVHIGSSSHFFILPEEGLSALYPEISDFTGYMNIHTEQDSQQEFGVFQSIGMSNRQLSKLLSYECLCYIGITMLVTLTVGILCLCDPVYQKAFPCGTDQGSRLTS